LFEVATAGEVHGRFYGDLGNWLARLRQDGFEVCVGGDFNADLDRDRARNQLGGDLLGVWMGGMELYPLEQPEPTFYGGGGSRSRIDHVVVSAGGREWWTAGVSSLVYGREMGHRVVTHRSDADRLSKFLGMGEWGRRWRKASGRARTQREAERRALPRALEAHEVAAFRAQWDKSAIESAAQAVEDLEAVYERKLNVECGNYLKLEQEKLEMRKHYEQRIQDLKR
jgi:hypothetical protein